MLCFLIWVLVPWVCSVCENSLRCVLLTCWLFCLHYIPHQGVKEILPDIPILLKGPPCLPGQPRPVSLLSPLYLYCNPHAQGSFQFLLQSSALPCLGQLPGRDRFFFSLSICFLFREWPCLDFWSSRVLLEVLVNKCSHSIIFSHEKSTCKYLQFGIHKFSPQGIKLK